MSACLHVCMSACLHVCMSACLHVWHVCMYACMHACMDGWMDVCMCVCMCVCVYACMHACMHACMYVSLKYTCIPQCIQYIIFLIQGAQINQETSKKQQIQAKNLNKKLKSSLRHTPVITFKTSLDSNRLDDVNAQWQRASLTTSRIIIVTTTIIIIIIIMKPENPETWNLKIMKNHEKHLKHETWKSRNHELRNVMTILHETWS